MGNLRANFPIRLHSLAGNGARCAPGHRILVDRDWPWDIPRESAPVDEWIPDLGPSRWLTEMFGEDPTRWGTFRSRYRRQLRSKARRALLSGVADRATKGTIVLVTASPLQDCSHSLVIREMLQDELLSR